MLRRRNRKVNQYPVIEKATSIFISDFPTDWVEADLWRMLKNYGTLVDVYIAVKRTKTSSRFGFARFIRVANTQELVGRLNDIPCGNSRLRANLAKYERKKVPPSPRFADNRHHRVSMETYQKGSERRTFADDVFESNRLNPMLACNDIGSEYDHGDWHDWRSENLESDDLSDEYELPETPRDQSPVKLSTPQSSEFEKSDNGIKSAHHPRENTRSRENSGSRQWVGNIRDGSCWNTIT
ncbi:hypothetical protein L2E82_09162 [Cichorium intybus]|uniref:Uncharacterized protein n=1 Tax=Cichorium intybus TaxID=13427 RepID=A0ACB9G8A6_CICIN|nr:hypothetical protein L2E82_09162 [Cichorium intybus]